MAFDAGVNVNFTAIGGIFYRVGEDIHDNLLDAVPVAVDGRRGPSWRGERVFVVLCVQFLCLADALDALAEVETGKIHFHASGIEAGERQQVLHDAGHTVCLTQNDAHEALVQLRGELIASLDDGFGIGFDVGQRGCAARGRHWQRIPCGSAPPGAVR